MTDQMKWHQGGCHCGMVRFETLLPDTIEVEDCNCSMCARTGYLHVIVPASRFHLLRGQDQISTYTFGTAKAQHTFCKVCGVKSFYVPRSNPDGFSVNLRCLDDPKAFAEVRIVNFDGKGDWEAQAQSLAYKSQA